MASTPVVHDHFVLLLETADFENLPAWLTDNFNVIEGGTHAGGSSRNKLIVFKDGTYLELFNWIKKPTEFLAWAGKRPGLIDFAVTTLSPVTAEQNHTTVQDNLSKISEKLDLGISYDVPLAGGRKCTDGTEVKWKNSRPSFKETKNTFGSSHSPTGRLDAPFFCHDVTERTVRVPFEREDVTSHPCGAVGIDSVEILVPQSRFDAYVALYKAVLGVEKPDHDIESTNEDGTALMIGVPHSISSQAVHVVVRSTQDDDAFFKERGIGVQRLTLRESQLNGQEFRITSLGDGPIGESIHLKMNKRA